MKLLKNIADFLAGPIGSWSYFVGRCIADGFHDRMEEIQEEEHMPEGMDLDDDRQTELSDPFRSGKVKVHGSN